MMIFKKSLKRKKENIVSLAKKECQQSILPENLFHPIFVLGARALTISQQLFVVKWSL